MNCIYRGLSLALCAQVPGFPELRKSLLRLAPRHVVIVSYFASRFSDVGNAFHTSLKREAECIPHGDRIFSYLCAEILAPCLFTRIASLPEDVKKQLEDPDSRWCF